MRNHHDQLVNELFFVFTFQLMSGQVAQGHMLMLAACCLGSQFVALAAARTVAETSKESVYTSDTWAVKSSIHGSEHKLIRVLL